MKLKFNKKNIFYYVLIIVLGYFIYRKWQEKESFLAPAPLSMYSGHEYCLETVEKGRPGCSSLISNNGMYKLVLQADKIVLIYIPENKVYWHKMFKTKRNGINIEPFRLVMQEDGNLVVYDNTNFALWNSNTDRRVRKNPYICHLNNDGNLMIKNKDNKIIWQTGSFYYRTRPTTLRSSTTLIPIQTRLTTTTTRRPTTQRPITSTTQRPITSTTQRPITSTTYRPIISTTQRPVTTTQRPTTTIQPLPTSTMLDLVDLEDIDITD